MKNGVIFFKIRIVSFLQFIIFFLDFSKQEVLFSSRIYLSMYVLYLACAGLCSHIYGFAVIRKSKRYSFIQIYPSHNPLQAFSWFSRIRRRLHESEVNSSRSEISRRRESGLCLHGATFMKCTSKLVSLYLVFRKIRLFSFL